MTDTNAIESAKHHEGALAERMAYAQALAAASLLPKSYQRQPANVLLAMEYGHALGLDTITAIQQVHVVEGKPTASAQLIGGLVRRAGHRLRVTGDDKHAVAEIIRRDDPDFTFRAEWTIARAQAAGLTGKTVWKQYPAAMLKARVITEVARDACPEALAGVAYTAEELGVDDFAPRSVTVADDPWTTANPAIGTIVEPTSVDTETGEIIDAETVEPTEPEPSTPAQRNAMGAMFSKCGINNRDERLGVTCKIIGRDVDSANALTKAEASHVIDTLKPLADADNPLNAFADWYTK